MADYYPVGTIAGRTTPAIAHVGGLDGNSARCAAHIKYAADVVRDSGEDAADCWNETHDDRY